MELRPTTEDDLPALYATFTEAVKALFAPRGFEPVLPPLEVFSNLQGHILRTGRSVVAVERDEVVAFGAAWTRGDDWFLASLFVRPGMQARGIGAALLNAVWGDASRRRTVTDSIQPVSNALYARRGLVPTTPVLTFAGTPRLDEPGVEAAANVAALDEAAYGFDRAVDHRYWERFARRTEWGDAYSYAFPGGAIGPVAGLTPDAAARALAAELSRAAEPVRVRVFGSVRSTVEVALRAGLRLEDVPGFLLVSDSVQPPAALVPSGYVLY